MFVRKAVFAAFVVASVCAIHSASAQKSPGVVMAAFGGGNGETWRESMAKPFTQATGIPVQVVDLPNTEPAVRASAGDPLYNVAWSSYFGAVSLYKDGLIEGFNFDDFPALKNVPEKLILRGSDGKVIGFPVQFQYYGIAFNTSDAKASDFQSWTSLGDPKWNGKLAQAQAFICANYDLPMFAHIAGGSESNLDAGIPEFRKFSKNASTILTSFAQGNTLLSRGEIAAVPFYSARVRALKKDGAPVDITLPKEGALLLPYMLVVPKGAKNRDALVKFLNYSLEPEGQLRMYDFSGYIPLNTSAHLSAKQVDELGMSLDELLKKLYVTDAWVQFESVKKATTIAETVQAAR